jgi:hypothetical protein
VVSQFWIIGKTTPQSLKQNLRERLYWHKQCHQAFEFLKPKLFQDTSLGLTNMQKTFTCIISFHLVSIDLLNCFFL